MVKTDASVPKIREILYYTLTISVSDLQIDAVWYITQPWLYTRNEYSHDIFTRYWGIP
jgi:hypothetical protein